MAFNVVSSTGPFHGRLADMVGATVSSVPDGPSKDVVEN